MNAKSRTFVLGVAVGVAIHYAYTRSQSAV